MCKVDSGQGHQIRAALDMFGATRMRILTCAGSIQVARAKVGKEAAKAGPIDVVVAKVGNGAAKVGRMSRWLPAKLMVSSFQCVGGQIT